MLDLMTQAVSNHPHGVALTVLLFVEHSLGKTPYGSVMGLVIAVSRAIIRVVFRRLFRKPNNQCPPCGKESHDASDRKTN